MAGAVAPLVEWDALDDVTGFDLALPLGEEDLVARTDSVPHPVPGDGLVLGEAVALAEALEVADPLALAVGEPPLADGDGEDVAVLDAVAEPLAVGEWDGEPDRQVEAGEGGSATALADEPVPLRPEWAGMGAGEPAVWPRVPVTLTPVALLLDELVDSTVLLSWTIAWRSGGTAAATPAANTAQATASAGRR